MRAKETVNAIVNTKSKAMMPAPFGAGERSLILAYVTHETEVFIN